MSYQVLARKYRPKNFDTLVGQEHVVRALTHALEQRRLHHAYLFTGTRGVGKTTLSRILAKSLNCIGADGNGEITAHPCGVCEVCRAIDAGRFVDYIEMDAASNRGVDEMAQLLEQAVYAPSNARFKVYMIDEVHMLTNHAFNSMLKTLEEPPEHVKFILATTDPQKIPVTVLSRCLQFNLKQMPPGHIVRHLDDILGQEGIAFETPALRLLAQGAHGSMRDALSLTDQAIAYAAGAVTLEAVQGMLGTLDQSYLIRVLDALAQQDGAALLAVADEMAARSLSYSAALQDLGTILHQVALAQTVPAALADDLPQREDVLRLAAQFDAEQIQLFYQIVVHGRNELGLAPDEYAGFSMTLLRMLAFLPLSASASADMPKLARAVTPEPVLASRSAPRTAAALATPSVARASASASADASVSPARAALAAARAASTGRGGTRMSPTAVALTVVPVVPAAPMVSNAPVTVPIMPSVPIATAALNAAPPWDQDAPPWAHEVSIDSAEQPDKALAAYQLPVAASPLMVAQTLPVPALEPVQIRVVIPAVLGWDGNWPLLAPALPLRGVAHQLARHSQLLRCDDSNGVLTFHFRIPYENLSAAGSIDKLGAALTEHFGRTVRVEVELGEVQHTADIVAQAEQLTRLRDAEQRVQGDPFLQVLAREFGALVMPQTIRPI